MGGMKKQCSGSVSFGYGSGPSDPFRGNTNPDLDAAPDPTENRKNTNFFYNFFSSDCPKNFQLYKNLKIVIKIFFV